jgi:uncharacterized protein YoxC
MKKANTQPSRTSEPKLNSLRSSRSKTKKITALVTTSTNIKDGFDDSNQSDDFNQFKTSTESSLKSILAEMETLRNSIQLLQQQNTELKSENQKLISENNQIFKDMDFLHYKLNKMEQNGLAKNVEIVGVPMIEHEDLGEVISKLFENTDYQHDNETITDVYRKKTPRNSGLPGTIVVSFNSTIKKMEFIEKTKGRNLTSSFISTLGTNRPVYINDHLTKHNKYLFYLARDLRRRKFVKYAWVNHGNILVKTGDNTDSMMVENVNNIESIKEKNHPSNQ